MTQADVRLAYQLMDVHNPFPVDEACAAMPLTWRLSSAVGKATSLHVSCVFVHLVVLISTALDAVQVRYGGILGKFSNLLMLQHGAPGDGKSIALWLMVQVLSYFDKVRDAVAKSKYRRDLQAFKQAAAEGGDNADAAAEPDKPVTADTIFNKGTFLGLGTQLHVQGGAAYLALHEGKSWLAHVFENGPGGGIEDLNQLMDHDLYKNHPVNNQSKFKVRNPHVCGVVLMHLEEILEQSTSEDTVAGLMRFLVAKFPVVVNKILPNLPPAEMQRWIENDPDYFNDVTYDDVVGGIANILLAAKSLFPLGRPRDGAAEPDKLVYSKITGIHTLRMAPDVLDHFKETFNASVDQVRRDLETLGGKASRLNKDKTRPLQLIAPVDVLEKVIAHLLVQSGKPVSEHADMTGEKILEALATLKAEDVCQKDYAELIPGEASLASVNCAVAMAEWFVKGYHMTMEAPTYVQRFRASRRKVSSLPDPSIEAAASLLSRAVSRLSDPAATYAAVTADLNWLSYAQRGNVSDDELSAKKFDFFVLAIMGFLHISNGKYALASYAAEEEGFLMAANRMTAWCPRVQMAELRSMCPTTGLGAAQLNEEAADAAITALHGLANGESVDVSTLTKPFRDVPAMALPPTPVATPAASLPGIPGAAGSSDAGVRAAAPGLTQASVADAMGEEEEFLPPRPKRMRLRDEQPLTPETFTNNKVLTCKILNNVLTSRSQELALFRIKDTYKHDASLGVLEKVGADILRLMDTLGLAAKSAQGKTAILLRPPEEHLHAAVRGLAAMLGLSESKKNKMQAALQTRRCNDNYDQQKFDDTVARIGDTFL